MTVCVRSDQPAVTIQRAYLALAEGTAARAVQLHFEIRDAVHRWDPAVAVTEGCLTREIKRGVRLYLSRCARICRPVGIATVRPQRTQFVRLSHA